MGVGLCFHWEGAGLPLGVGTSAYLPHLHPKDIEAACIVQSLEAKVNGRIHLCKGFISVKSSCVSKGVTGEALHENSLLS